MGLEITFKGISSASKDVIVQKLPVLQSPNKRVEVITIPGRDGNLTSTQDDYESYRATCEMVITDITKRTEIATWLSGAGDLIVSDYPDYKVKARVINGLSPIHFMQNLKKIIVEFEIQPFLYQATPVADIIITGTTNITNPGTRFSLPIITVTGTGTTAGFSIDGASYLISELGITINSEIMETYKAGESKNNKLVGAFPIIPIGISEVKVLYGTITQIKITPNWRWY